MHLGFTSMNTPEDVRPDVLAGELESRGFESLWIGEHSHIPTSRRTPHPAGGEMPAHYRRMMNPFVSLAMAAQATSTLRLATGVCLVLEHDVLDLAKTVATLDVLSGGRVLFGVGVGWNEEELANHRPYIAWRDRYRATEECVSALRTCWTSKVAEHHGEFFDFEPSWVEPQPQQRPHPPVIFGGAGPVGLDHTMRWADEWAPMDIAFGNVARKLDQVADAAAAHGRRLPVTLVAWGDPTADRLREYRDLGVHRVVLGAGRAGWSDPASALPFLDRYTPLVASLA